MGKILVLGAAGYIGSALAEFLTGRDCDVDLIDNYYTPSNLKVVNSVVIKNIDIRDKDLDFSEYDTIFHLAGVVGIRDCEEKKEEAFDINVKGTFNILKSFRGRIIYASTSAVYGRAERPELDEVSPTNPVSQYGITNLKAEELVSLCDNYCILRFSNVYGKGITYKRNVADLFIERALKEQPLLIHGDGKQRRDFVHIKDVLKAYWYAMSSPCNDIFNIGGNEAININEIAKLVQTNYRELFGLIPKVNYIPIDCGVIWRDFAYINKKAKVYLGYEPSYKVEDEIRSRLNAHSKKKKSLDSRTT